MTAQASIVKLCVFTAPVPVCDQSNPAAPKSLLFHSVYDGNGAFIAPNSQQYPTTVAVDGALFGGIGFVRSYFTDTSGAVVPPPSAFSYGDCEASSSASSASDFEIGCVSDSTTPTTDPIPVRVIRTVAPNGTVTMTYENMVTGAPVFISATMRFDENCDRYSYETVLGCVRDAAGKIVKTGVTRADTFDTTISKRIAFNYFDSSGAALSLAAGEVFGDCAVTQMMVFDVCAYDPSMPKTPSNPQTLRQQVPVDPATGLLNYSAALYTTIAGAAVAAPAHMNCGCCSGAVCTTCP